MAFENAACRMSAMLFMLQCVKTLSVGSILVAEFISGVGSCHIVIDPLHLSQAFMLEVLVHTGQIQGHVSI